MTHSPRSAATVEELLKSFLEFERLGLRAKAKESAQALVDALPTLEAKQAWTQVYLPVLPTNEAGCVQHDIYRGIVFPALLAGYESNDPEACYWLGVTFANVTAIDAFSDQIRLHFARFFLELAYQKDRSSKRYRLALLGQLTQGLKYVFHEWPSGILIDHENWRSELAEIRRDIELSAFLDETCDHAEWLNGLLEKTIAYEDRLLRWESGQ